MEQNLSKICPICNQEITVSEDMVFCPACNTPHHIKCWNAHHGCGVFLCSDSPEKREGEKPSEH